MKQNTFLLFLTAITFLGFILRFVDYDRIPGWNESLDEIHYAWTGQTWIKTGTPTSWSHLSSYPQSKMVKLWNTEFRIVSPMLEKPPLYSLLSGALVLSFGQNEMSEVRISTIRLLPLFLSIVTIFLTGILARKVFSSDVALVSTLLYATVPPIVLANRLSVTENLLTPLILATQLVILTPTYKVGKLPHVYFVGIFSAVAILTKQIGIVIAVTSLVLYSLKKQWKSFFISAAIIALAFSIYPLTGFVYDWPLFQLIQEEQRRIGLQGGLPQLVQTIVSRPLVTTEKLFPDGVMLFGYLLFFTSPWWMVHNYLSLRGVLTTKSRGAGSGSARQSQTHLKTFNQWSIIFLSFPFVYLTYLALAITGAEPIGSGQGFWGWYVYPLFHYLTILVGVVLVKLWHSFSLFESLITTLILGSSMIRYALLFFPREVHYRWQHLLVGLVCVNLILQFLPHHRRRQLMGLLGVIFIGVNLYTNFHLASIYSAIPQR